MFSMCIVCCLRPVKSKNFNLVTYFLLSLVNSLQEQKITYDMPFTKLDTKFLVIEPSLSRLGLKIVISIPTA
jgi:hypothetical protein